MQAPPKFLHEDSLAMCQRGRRQRFVLHLCSKAAPNPGGTWRFWEAKALRSEALDCHSQPNPSLPQSPGFRWDRRSLQKLMWFANVLPFQWNSSGRKVHVVHLSALSSSYIHKHMWEKLSQQVIGVGITTKVLQLLFWKQASRSSCSCTDLRSMIWPPDMIGFL